MSTPKVGRPGKKKLGLEMTKKMLLQYFLISHYQEVNSKEYVQPATDKYLT